MLQTTRKVNCTSLWNVQFLGQTWNLSQMTQIAWVKSTWVKISGHGQIFQELTWKMTVSIKIVVFRLNVSQNNWSDFVFEKKFEKSTKVTCVGLSQVQTQILRISTKHQIQNLDQTSASRLNLKFKILTKLNFRILTKIQLHSLYSTKILTKLQLQILPELQLQNIHQTLSSTCKQKFSFMTKPQLPNQVY